MRDVRLYDVYTLKDGNEYAVIGITEYEFKNYLLLSKVINHDELSDKEIKYVECYEKNGKNVIREVKDSAIISKLSDIFASQLKMD